LEIDLKRLAGVETDSFKQAAKPRRLPGWYGYQTDLVAFRRSRRSWLGLIKVKYRIPIIKVKNELALFADE
jgi:hypothetical protein